eukprot:TRINITY_DN6466_c0_g1_i3.p2 TRINITY_DN6466_c0_g1~~TRINITY_DN6466_c0_g1_i3.p2  ORF type:complete len:143 (-),score=21.14 TRINITY_DN6466_c0_g1_i3:575-1003(-)
MDLLDESCLLADMQQHVSLVHLTVFDTWDLGQRGLDAYRTEFCSRRLVLEFSSVWCTVVTVDALALTALRLLETDRRRLRDATRMRAGTDPALPHQAGAWRKLARSRQSEMAADMSNMLTCAIFGVLVPSGQSFQMGLIVAV